MELSSLSGRRSCDTNAFRYNKAHCCLSACVWPRDNAIVKAKAQLEVSVEICVPPGEKEPTHLANVHFGLDVRNGCRADISCGE